MIRSLVCLPLVIVMSFTLGCQNQQALADIEEMKAQTAVEDQNKEIGRQFFVAIDENDFDKLNELLDPDFALYVPGLPDALGKEALIQAISTHYASFPDWRHVIDDVVAEGDQVAIRLTQYGTHAAEFYGIPATGNEIEVAAIHLATIVDGKVKDWWLVEDYLGQYQQLGMELRPAAVEE
jgi:steroid delta-isomerase-like uncharacterized protein